MFWENGVDENRFYRNWLVQKIKKKYKSQPRTRVGIVRYTTLEIKKNPYSDAALTTILKRDSFFFTTRISSLNKIAGSIISVILERIHLFLPV